MRIFLCSSYTYYGITKGLKSTLTGSHSVHSSDTECHIVQFAAW